MIAGLEWALDAGCAIHLAIASAAPPHADEAFDENYELIGRNSAS